METGTSIQVPVTIPDEYLDLKYLQLHCYLTIGNF